MYAFEISGLCKSYKSFKLNDINLTLPKGCIMGLIGENGAGKSTTINLLLDIIEKDAGTIRILGNDIDENAKEIKDNLGVVLDEPCFSPLLNAKEINKIMKHTYTNWDEEEFFKLLERFNIDKKKNTKTYSKGMKMKLSIAVALSHKAKLLILDEPTGGLDPIIRNEIVDIFYEFTRNPENSVLISSHIVSDLEKLCDYVAFIHKGELILCEEKDRLLDRFGIIRCTAEEFKEINADAIKSKKVSAYGVEAIVERDKIPADFEISPIGIEEFFVSVVRGIEV